jgi:hypothetical protein
VPGNSDAACAIRSHAEKDQIEDGNLPGLQFEKLAKSLFIGLGYGCGVRIFRGHPENIFFRHWNLGQHGLIRHPVIAVGVGGRNVAFIAPEK